MYSEQLESLIQSIIADGIITEKERAVLHKRAQAEGVDIDELDVYVDGLINQMFPKKVEVIEDDYNINLFNRIRRNEAIYDIYRTPYCFYEEEIDKLNGWNDGDIRIQLVYYKKDRESEKQLNIVLQYTGSKDWLFFYDLLFETDNGSVLLSENDINASSAMNRHPKSFIIDIIEMKKLCNSSTIRIKLKYHYSVYENKEGKTEFQEIDRNLPTFLTYLQEFYHDTIDNTAFSTVKTKIMQIQEQITASIEKQKRNEKRKKIKDDVIAYLLFTPLGWVIIVVLLLLLL